MEVAAMAVRKFLENIVEIVEGICLIVWWEGSDRCLNERV